MTTENPTPSPEQQRQLVRDQLTQQIASLGFSETPEVTQKQQDIQAFVAGRSYEQLETEGQAAEFGDLLGQYQEMIEASLNSGNETDSAVVMLVTTRALEALGWQEEAAMRYEETAQLLADLRQENQPPFEIAETLEKLLALQGEESSD